MKLFANAVVAMFVVMAFTANTGYAQCGNGMVEGPSEECDPGGTAHIDGDPNNPTCSGGSNCFFATSCCKVNCQYVGDSDIACDDGNECTGPDFCNQVGDCNATQDPVTNGTPCDDGLFCTLNDTCTDGTCSGTGDPCSGTECNTCQEDTDTCFDPIGTACEGSEPAECQVGTCDGAGACGVSGAPDATPCDDGVFCNGSDTCLAGACDTHAGDPCPGTECNTCQEDIDTCFDPIGTACTDDANVCTTDECSGAGVCDHNNNTLFCDDGVFCNGQDLCGGGTCSPQGIDPCDDAVGCTDDTCDEGLDACTNTANDANCDDTLFCNGSEICDEVADCQAGTDPCIDGNACTTDDCDEGGDACQNDPIPEFGACDDGDLCSLDDQCVGGECMGTASAFADLCPWTLLTIDPNGKDKMKTGRTTNVVGDFCGGTIIVGQQSVNDSTVASAKTTGKGGVKIAPFAQILDDIITAGAGVKGKPGSVLLPTLDVSKLDGGTTTLKTDATGSYDLTGTHPLIADCNAARASFSAALTQLDALGSTQPDLGPQKLRSGSLLNITPTVVGGTNVVDIEGLRTGRDSVIDIDGGGDADTVFVIRISKFMKLAGRNTVQFSNSQLPENVLFYVNGKKCQLGDKATGGGTILCGSGKVQVGNDSVWNGVLFAGRKVMKIGDNAVITHTPFQGF